MSRWYDTEKKQLCLAYLFLSSENRISDADFSLFERVGNSVEGFSNIKGEIIGECEKLLTPPDGSKTRFEIVSDLLSEGTTSEPEENRSVLWSLICLLFQIEGKSENKEQLVGMWAKKGNIDDSVLLEMQDTCKTQNAIVEYQKWLETSKGMGYPDIKTIMQELEKNLQSMQQSVSDLIALG